jgi:hypothetical protein
VNDFDERLHIAAMLFAARYPVAMHLTATEIQAAMDQTIEHAELLMERHRAYEPDGTPPDSTVFAV